MISRSFGPLSDTGVWLSVLRLDHCLELLIRTNRLPEAAFLARTYLPSQVSRVVKLWRESLAKVNQKAAESLADPTEYENLFPGLKESFVAEQFLRETCLGNSRPATDYPLVTVSGGGSMWDCRDEMEISGLQISKLNANYGCVFAAQEESNLNT